MLAVPTGDGSTIPCPPWMRSGDGGPEPPPADPSQTPNAAASTPGVRGRVLTSCPERERTRTTGQGPQGAPKLL